WNVRAVMVGAARVGWEADPGDVQRRGWEISSTSYVARVSPDDVRYRYLGRFDFDMYYEGFAVGPLHLIRRTFPLSEDADRIDRRAESIVTWKCILALGNRAYAVSWDRTQVELAVWDRSDDR
ncbi:MAG: hypothetical protein ACRC7O_11315, partial [Fimbriiglobus sp.]